MIEIIPAMDISEGRCGRRPRGEYEQETSYSESPVAMAEAFRDCGVRRIHLVDLDGARLGMPANVSTLEQIKERVDIQVEWGGGIASDEALDEILGAGADFAIIGSVAALRPELMEAWMRSGNGGRLILGADVKDGKVAVRGWTRTVALTIEELVERFAPLGLSNVICTDISRDGMLQGPSFELYAELQKRFPKIDVTVSGGISSMDDIRKLDALGLRKTIVGKAIYEKHISLDDIRLWSQNA